MLARSAPLPLAALLAVLPGSAACQRDKTGKKPPAAAEGPGQQTFAEAMKVVCDGPNDPDLPPRSTGVANRAVAMAAAIDKRVRNQEVRELMVRTASLEGTEAKVGVVLEGARRAGIEECALAEMWREAATARQRDAVDPESPEPTSPEPPALPSEPQTFDEAIAILCSAPMKGLVDEGLPAADDIHNPEAQTLLDSLAGAPSAQRVRLLRAAAARTGQPTCALADYWETAAKPSARPPAKPPAR